MWRVETGPKFSVPLGEVTISTTGKSQRANIPIFNKGDLETFNAKIENKIYLQTLSNNSETL